MKFPDKIYVIGWFWSGKSSFAKHIAAIKKISFFDLDDIRRLKKYSHKLSDDERKQKLDEILQHNKQRIIEWCVIDRADECYLLADLVIVFKIPWYIAAWRIMKRYFSRMFSWKSVWTFLWMLSLMYRAYMYYQWSKGKYSFHRHIEDCKKYKCNYIIIRDAKEILD
jgi:adenylate kinase family enzyme